MVVVFQVSHLCSPRCWPGGLWGHSPGHSPLVPQGDRYLSRSRHTSVTAGLETSPRGAPCTANMVIFTKYFWKNECKVQETQSKLLERST